jgi:hypothetical protein
MQNIVKGGEVEQYFNLYCSTQSSAMTHVALILDGLDPQNTKVYYTGSKSKFPNAGIH